MDVAIYGGSFNPPHIGHALVAAWLTWTNQADQVWLLPTYDHAFGKRMAPWALRTEWCAALAQSIGTRVSVCAIEAELPVPSYSIDTLTELARRHPSHRFRLVIGSDNLLVLDKWKDWDRIEAQFAPIVVGRAGYPCPEGSVVFPEVSSTQVREALGRGESVSHLIPAAVRQLIPADVYA